MSIPVRPCLMLMSLLALHSAWVGFDYCHLLSEKDCYGSTKSKGSKAKIETALKELREHISKLETRFAFKYPYALPKTQIDPRKLYIKVSDDQPEDLLSDGGTGT